MKVERITYPIGTKKENKRLCQCEIETINPYVESVRKFEAKGSKTAYAKLEHQFQCTRAAAVMIDDTPMCRIHGGGVALEYLIALHSGVGRSQK